MEATSCVKAVVVATKQYLNNSSDAHLVHLQRQLDVLISVTANGSLLTYFDPRQLLPTECITCLADLISDSQIKPAISQRAMQLLNNLANEELIREALHSKFHLTTTLASYLRCCMSTPSDPVIIQCVKLLQRITYNCHIPFQETYLDELLKFIVKHIQNTETELTQPCLGLMANLVRNNFAVQTYMKNMDKLKSFFMALVTFLSHKHQTTVIYALTILSSLSLPEDFSERLFNDQNIHQTFQVIFNILLNGDSTTSRRYTVDLFTDILRQPHIQESLTKYEYLQPCIKQVLNLLGNVAFPSAAKIFELLLSFCSVNSIRCLVCHSLLKSSALQDPVRYKILLSEPQAHLSEPFFAVVHWAAQSVETHDSAPLLALEFLKEIYLEMIDLGMLGDISPRTELVLPMVTEILMAPQDYEGFVVQKRCLRVVRAVQLLLALSNESSLQDKVAAAVDTKTCVTLIEHQFTHNHISIKQTHNAVDHDDWSEVGVDVVLYTMQLMSRIRHLVVNMESTFAELLQDPLLVPFLAFAMTSHRERVQVALYLITRGAAMDAFPTEVLGEAIAAYNGNKGKSTELKELNISNAGPPSPKRMAWSQMENKENVPFKSKDSLRSELDLSVDMLIKKVETGMELKDVRASEIINVYEHKLQSLQTKEDHLQDLLEAKALALAQADRLISQYRCRRAQSEAEAQKMRAMLRDSEQRAEEYQDMMLEHDHLRAEYEQVVAENTRLEAVAEEHKDLMQAYQEQTQRLESIQRNLATLKQEHQTMTEMHDMLMRHNETLKQQNDVASEQLDELQEERKSQSRLIKKMESKEKELVKNLSKMEDKLKDQDEMDRAIDKLRLTLTKTESDKKQMQHQVTSLELVCQQHEEEIQEKDQLLRTYKTEIDKHAQIAALIHNLSSGNPPGSKT